jgi:hypothetical protein
MGIWNSHIGTFPPHTCCQAHGTLLQNQVKGSLPPPTSLHVCRVALHCTRELRAHYLVHQLDSKTKLVSALQITLLSMSYTNVYGNGMDEDGEGPRIKYRKIEYLLLNFMPLLPPTLPSLRPCSHASPMLCCHCCCCCLHLCCCRLVVVVVVIVILFILVVAIVVVVGIVVAIVVVVIVVVNLVVVLESLFAAATAATATHHGFHQSPQSSADASPSSIAATVECCLYSSPCLPSPSSIASVKSRCLLLPPAITTVKRHLRRCHLTAAVKRH